MDEGKLWGGPNISSHQSWCAAAFIWVQQAEEDGPPHPAPPGTNLLET